MSLNWFFHLFRPHFDRIRENELHILRIVLFTFQKLNRETAALPLFTIHTDSRFVQFHQFLNQRKTDTRTLLIKQILVQQIFKTDKKGSFLAFRNSYTLILHTNRHIMFIFMNEKRNHLTLWSILESIGKQIEDNLFQLIRIYPQFQGRHFTFEYKINMMLFGQRFKIIHDMVYKRNNIYLLYTQLHLIFLYFAEIKNLVHQAKHTVGITFYYMQLLTYIIRQSLVFQNIFHWTCNQCQRSAKFVRNICKKAKLYIRNLLFHRHFMFQTINSKQYIYS